MTTKVCNQCKEVKPLTDFYKHPKTRDGRFQRCKECKREYYQKNREEKIAYARKWHQQNKQHKLEYNKSWKKANLGLVNAKQARRRAAKLQATPKWTDLEKIKEVYKEAHRLTKLLGIKMHVDHIIPLQGELVCGLHVPNNLQIITATENLRKSNKLLQY